MRSRGVRWHVSWSYVRYQLLPVDTAGAQPQGLRNLPPSLDLDKILGVLYDCVRCVVLVVRAQAFLPVERALFAAGMRDGDVVTLVDGQPATQETLTTLGERAHSSRVGDFFHHLFSFFCGFVIPFVFSLFLLFLGVVWAAVLCLVWRLIIFLCVFVYFLVGFVRGVLVVLVVALDGGFVCVLFCCVCFGSAWFCLFSAISVVRFCFLVRFCVVSFGCSRSAC